MIEPLLVSHSTVYICENVDIEVQIASAINVLMTPSTLSFKYLLFTNSQYLKRTKVLKRKARNQDKNLKTTIRFVHGLLIDFYIISYLF